MSKKSKDDVHYKFKNGSEINILAAKESSRGQRRTGREKFFTSLDIERKNTYCIFNIYYTSNKYFFKEVA